MQSLFVLGISWDPLNTQFVWDRGVGGRDSLEKALVEAPVQRRFTQREDLVQALLGQVSLVMLQNQFPNWTNRRCSPPKRLMVWHLVSTQGILHGALKPTAFGQAWDSDHWEPSALCKSPLTLALQALSPLWHRFAFHLVTQKSSLGTESLCVLNNP